jgi:hypothetical protein
VREPSTEKQKKKEKVGSISQVWYVVKGFLRWPAAALAGHTELRMLMGDDRTLHAMYDMPTSLRSGGGEQTFVEYKQVLVALTSVLGLKQALRIDTNATR